MNGIAQPDRMQRREACSLPWPKPSRMFLAALLMLFTTLAPARGIAQPHSEYEVKAAFIFNFLKFTEFRHPSRATGGRIVICPLAEETVRNLFLPIEGKEIGKRTVELRFPPTITAECDVVFVQDTPVVEVSPEALLRSSLSGVLTVGESSSFLERGGLIRFVERDRKVRFTIRHELLGRETLEISSKLLGMALRKENIP